MVPLLAAPAISPGLLEPFPLQFGSNLKPVSKISSDETIQLLRIIIGVMGNVVCILLYAAPILTFRRVIRTKTTGQFSCIPYIMALLNCVIYTWYGSPLVSHGWDNLLLVTINGTGIVLELCFIGIYFWYASPSGRKIVTLIMAPVIVAFCVLILVFTFELPEKHQRKNLVGTIGLVVSIAMYGSPLVAMKQVIRTKSVEFMPFFLSLFTFLTSSCWLAYGLLSSDLLLASPNFLGTPLGFLQLVLYCIYKNYKKGISVEEAVKDDLENGEGGSSVDLKTPLLSPHQCG